MLLKRYQQDVIADLENYLARLTETKHLGNAFEQHWADKGIAVKHLGGFPPYKTSLPQVPQVCIKVPTGGGKTFLACHAVSSIFKHIGSEPSQFIVWLVPSESIFRQTLQSLQNPDHPYRQKLNQLFQNRVQVIDKEKLLSGASLDPESVQKGLVVCVLIYASLRAKNKDDLRLYKENSNLMQFQNQVENEGLDISAMEVVKTLRPVVVVDESHNATSDLSVDMLKNLAPRFVLELTATPRSQSNIISFVDAMALKLENMVKLPVLVYNHPDRADLLANALGLRRKLEQEAIASEQNGGLYIRPILLLQAQPKVAGSDQTFADIKKALVQAGIPTHEVAIKTAEIDDLKAWPDLQSRDCPIRYIITVNALKEGWDCPFAYILASMANKSSAVDVEQILGRVLRLPGAKKHTNPALNTSYVLTASAQFQATLQNIVQALNRSGFSEKDYRMGQVLPDRPLAPVAHEPHLSFLPPEAEDSLTSEIEMAVQTFQQIESENNTAVNPIEAILKQAAEEQNQFREAAEVFSASGSPIISQEEMNYRKTYQIKAQFKKTVSNLLLPSFYIDTPQVLSGIFAKEGQSQKLLEKEDLLSGYGDASRKFKLTAQNVDINFQEVESALFRIDLEETKAYDYRPAFQQLNQKQAGEFLQYINSQPLGDQNRLLTDQLCKELKRLNTPPHQDVKKYVAHLVENLNPEDLAFVKQHVEVAALKIKRKIEALKEAHMEENFYLFAELRKIKVKPDFQFIDPLPLTKTAQGIPSKSLYEQEGEMGQAELRMIAQIASLDNLEWWHRNPSPQGFGLNAFTGHYPDFIVGLRSGTVVLIETKGEQLANDDSRRKIKMGAKWAEMAGNQFRYFMVFETKAMEGAKQIGELVGLLGQL